MVLNSTVYKALRVVEFLMGRFLIQFKETKRVGSVESEQRGFGWILLEFWGGTTLGEPSE